MKKIQITIWLILILVFTVSNTYADYNLDTDLLYEEESIYKSSEWNIELLINKDDGEASALREGTIVDFQTDIGAAKRVERLKDGYWFDGGFAFSYNKYKPENDDSSYDDREDIFLSIEGFERIYQGLFRHNYCDVGYKRYFSEQNPFYYFGQGLFYWWKNNSDYDDSRYGQDNYTPEISAGTGIGYGKIVDLGSYQRILILQNELLDAGIIKSEFKRSTITLLIPLFRIKMNETNRLKKVQSILINEGLIDKQSLTLDIASDIIDAIDESFDKREYGFEARVGYLQELVHRDPDQDTVGRLNAYAKYEKPLSKKHQYTIRGDFFREMSFGSEDDNDNKGIELQIKNYLSSLLSSNLESRIGIDLIYKKDSERDYTSYYTDDSEEDFTENDPCERADYWDIMNIIDRYAVFYPDGMSVRLYGVLDYELTDTVTWRNGVYYTLINPDDSSYSYYGTEENGDTQSAFGIISELTYILW
jgi:hypothetical protein